MAPNKKREGRVRDLEGILGDAVAAGDAPYLVAMVADRQRVLWSGSAGEAAPGRAAATDTVFRIYSMTKAVGSLAAMLLVERGQLGLDQPVDEVLPQFAELKVLDGFDGEEPVLRPPKTRATIRHLATHTSGLVYEYWNADLAAYLERTGRPSVISGRAAGLAYPLAFDPGTRWGYGIGIDWLGRVVEAVDGRRIDKFCQDEIFAPLGMTDTGFEAGEGDAGRLAAGMSRGRDGTHAPFGMTPPSEPEFYGMGHALFSTAPDYLKFLQLFLNGGKHAGGRLIGPESFEVMATNQIGDLRVTPMVSAMPRLSADVDLFPGAQKTHTFGFVRLEEDVPGMRAAGSLGWAGIFNTHYWIDPATGIAAVLMTQALPFADPRFMDVFQRFERAVYGRFGNTS
ncbi:CubicO group peptidase (beta-lactamase class C family) [Rhodobium orientis]|nr:serine hydrolase domain-containing protein [Rhodobium orientis]MBB4301492.1 CubicO group peptidase (beta-lactamase class C family) [Rhodobium orientis]